MSHQHHMMVDLGSYECQQSISLISSSLHCGFHKGDLANHGALVHSFLMPHGTVIAGCVRKTLLSRRRR
eukprot:1604228-Amphidinium_carterae.5